MSPSNVTRALGFLALVLWAAGCRDPKGASGTALRVEVSWSPRQVVEQLRFSVSDEGPVGESVVRPETVDGDLASAQSLRLKLADALAGKEVVVQVDALVGGVAVARGTTTAVVVKGLEVDARVELGVSATTVRFAPAPIVQAAGECGAAPLRLLLTEQGEPASFPEAIDIALTSSAATGEFFADAACAQPQSQVRVPGGASEVGVYYRDTKAGRPLVTSLPSLRFLDAATVVLEVGAGAPHHLALSAGVQPVTAGDCRLVTVEVRDSFDNATTARANFFVAPASTSATSRFYQDELCAGAMITTGFIGAGNSSTGFNVRDNTAGKHVLTVAAPGLASGALEVVFAPRTAKRLVFTTQPSGAAAAAELSPVVSVAVTDTFNNVVPLDGVALTLALDPPKSALPVSAAITAQGVASFPGLRVDRTGTFQLVVSSIDFSSTASEPFTVTSGVAAGLAFLDAPPNVVAGQTLPKVRVAVVDSGGNVAVGSTAAVTVALSAAGLQGTTTVAAVQGVAEFTNLSVNTAGVARTLGASAGGWQALSTAFDVTAAAPAALSFAAQPSNATAGTALAPAVTVAIFDALGNPCSGFSGTVSLVLSGGAAVSGATVAAVAGVASFSSLRIDAAGGPYTLTAQVGTFTSAPSNPFIVAPAAATKLVFLSQPAGGVANVPLAQTKVALRDDYGNTVSQALNVTMGFGANPVGGTLGGTLVQPLTAGVATFGNLTLNSAGAGYALSASAPGFPAVTSGAFEVLAAGSNRLEFVGTMSNGVAGQPLSRSPETYFEVHIVDGAGTQVTTSGVPITVALGPHPAGAALSGTVQVLTNMGTAIFTDARLQLAGAGYGLVASASTYASGNSTTFNVSPGPLAALVFAAEPPLSAVAGQSFPAPAIRVLQRDQYSNLVTTSLPITLGTSVAPAGGAVGGCLTLVNSSGGSATFSNCFLNKVGTYTLQASRAASPSVNAAAPTVVTAGPAHHLAFRVQPATTLVAGSPALSFTVGFDDAYGNEAASGGPMRDVSVALFSAPVGANLSGVTTVTQVGSVASFSGLSINRTGPVTLQVTSNGLAPATSDAFNVIPGAADHLEYASQPPATVTSKATLSPLTVRVRDAAGNLATSLANVTLSLALFDGKPWPMNGTLSKPASTGEAVFNDLSVDKMGTYHLVASGGLLASTNSSGFDVVPGARYALTMANAPSSGRAGQAFGTITVQVVDQAGNVVADSTTQVTMRLWSPGLTGSLSGLTLATTIGGTATFDGLSVDKAGPCRLDASTLGLVSVSSPLLNVTGGDPASLSFVQQPTTTRTGQVITPGPSVMVYDLWGNTATGALGQISMSAPSANSAGQLSGDLKATPDAGLATFPGLIINSASSGFTLQATSGYAGNAVSASFDVPSTGPNRLQITSSAKSAIAGVCTGPVTVQSIDSAGAVTAVTENHKLTFAWAAPADGTFGATGCGSALPLAFIMFPAGASQVTFFFMPFTAGNPELVVTDEGLTNNLGSARQVESVAPGPLTQVMLDLPQAATRLSTCSCRAQVRATDAHGNQTKVASNTVVALSGVDLTFSDGCLASNVTQVTIAADAGSAGFNYSGVAVGAKTMAASSVGLTGDSRPVPILPSISPGGACPGASTVCLPDAGTCQSNPAGRCWPANCVGPSCVLVGRVCDGPADCCSGVCCGGLCRPAGPGACGG
jgi:uncharacterized protein YndB with AHSA1/START domain